MNHLTAGLCSPGIVWTARLIYQVNSRLLTGAVFFFFFKKKVKNFKVPQKEISNFWNLKKKKKFRLEMRKREQMKSWITVLVILWLQIAIFTKLWLIHPFRGTLYSISGEYLKIRWNRNLKATFSFSSSEDILPNYIR